MGNYIESNLARDEKIIMKAEVSWLSQLGHFNLVQLIRPLNIVL